MVAAIAAGDAEAMNRVIGKYSRLLWPIASAVLKNAGSEQDVEECVADVFIQLWQHPDHFNPQRGTLKSWLCIVARSRAQDRFRKLSRCNTVSVDDVMLIGRMGVHDYIVQEENKREVADALNQLSLIDREILIRRYYYEQKPREISLAMNLSVKEINNHLYRSKQKLRKAVSLKGGLA